MKKAVSAMLFIEIQKCVLRFVLNSQEEDAQKEKDLELGGWINKSDEGEKKDAISSEPDKEKLDLLHGGGDTNSTNVTSSLRY